MKWFKRFRMRKAAMPDSEFARVRMGSYVESKPMVSARALALIGEGVAP